MNIEAADGGKSSRKRFWKNSSQCREILLQVKWVMASFCCYENSDVIATLIITNFHLYLIQLWWQFFQIFVHGNVVYAQTWEVLTLTNYNEPPYCFNTTTGKFEFLVVFILKYEPMVSVDFPVLSLLNYPIT